MSIIPSVAVITGVGKPRLILVMQPGTEIYTSVGTTTFDSTSVTEADDGSTAVITSSSVANPTVLTTATHGLTAGQWSKVAGHSGSTPSINGNWKVENVPTTTTLKIAVNVTVGGTGGTIARTPAFVGRGIAVGMRVRSGIVSGSLTETVYGKITAIDDTLNKITVDEWIGGTPTNGQAIVIDGWVADLPRCQRLRQTFTPDELVHPVYRRRLDVKKYGYLYQCECDYSTFITGDTLLLMQKHLSPREFDRLILIPHKDRPQFAYNVHQVNPIDLEMFGSALGHKGVRFVFVGTESVPNFPMISTGYGFGYGQNYGNQL